MVKFVLSRKFRLSTPTCFTHVFQKSKRISTTGITLLGRRNLLEHPRIGLIISKKYINRAHERNRIKRLIRESFRLCRYKLLFMDFIAIVKPEISNLDNQIIIKKLEELWHFYYR